ncbi:MAG: alpha/beta fold hydrolase [bacterium]
MPVLVEKVTFSSAAGSVRLEGSLGRDTGIAAASGIVLCHPHPLYGGSMDNNVVSALFRAFTRAGYVTLAFNFRGVGGSEGRYEDGEGEAGDVEGAIRFLEGLPWVRPESLGLWGYSFGAWVGLRAAARGDRVRCLGAVAPPTGLYSFEFLAGCKHPFYAISGNEDPFCPAASRDALLPLLEAVKEWRILQGVDHFFWGREEEMARFACQAFHPHLSSGCR